METTEAAGGREKKEDQGRVERTSHKDVRTYIKTARAHVNLTDRSSLA